MRPLVLSAPLSDGVVTVRHWREDDIPAIVAACQDPEIPRWTSVPSPYSEADARAFQAELAPAMEAGERCSFAMVEGDAVAGAIGFPRLSWAEERAEVGYWLAADARGRGLTVRAVRLVCDWGFDECGFQRIELIAATGNPASQAVAVRAGFTREGVLRSYVLGKGERHDMVMFSLLPGDRQVT